MSIQYRSLSKEEIPADFLLHFERRQEVTHRYCWRGKRLVCRRDKRIEDWNDDDRQKITHGLSGVLDSGGAVFGAFDGEQLAGFASVRGDLMGSQAQLLQLEMLHVSLEHRNRGIGKTLFELAARAARERAAQKLYISANSARESVLFYRARDCVPTTEIIPALHEQEPWDIHMEYDLGLAYQKSQVPASV